MLAALDELVRLLRANRVAVTTGALIDAARALAAVGLDDRAVVHAALRATLVGSAADLPLFDELFELVFRRGVALPGQGALADRLAAAGLPRELADWLAERLAEDVAVLGPLARAALGMRALDLDALLAAGGLAAELDQMTSPLQVGYQSYRLAEALGLDALERELGERVRQLAARAGAAPAEVDAAGGVVREAIGGVRGALRQHVEARFRKGHLRHREEVAVQALGARPFSQLGAAELVELRAEVGRLARVLNARLVAMPSQRRRGRLDLRRTLRRSLATGGVPFALRHRPRQARKPRLVVLCDISDSVRNVSRFMLELTYALHERWDHVYAFAFVADLGELTLLFRTHEIGHAIELAYGGAVVSTFANSNYGRALEAFCARHLAKVNRRTTVLVIGDGRSNYHPPRAELLAAIRRRARQVLWINPEPPSAWGFGDSAMREYAPHCDRVAVAHNLDSLRKVIDDLVA